MQIDISTTYLAFVKSYLAIYLGRTTNRYYSTETYFPIISIYVPLEQKRLCLRAGHLVDILMMVSAQADIRTFPCPSAVASAIRAAVTASLLPDEVGGLSGAGAGLLRHDDVGAQRQDVVRRRRLVPGQRPSPVVT